MIKLAVSSRDLAVPRDSASQIFGAQRGAPPLQVNDQGESFGRAGDENMIDDFECFFF